MKITAWHSSVRGKNPQPYRATQLNDITLNIKANTQQLVTDS